MSSELNVLCVLLSGVLDIFLYQTASFSSLITARAHSSLLLSLRFFEFIGKTDGESPGKKREK